MFIHFAMHFAIHSVMSFCLGSGYFLFSSGDPDPAVPPRLLHRLQFSLVEPGDRGPPAPDLVPRDPASGRPLRYTIIYYTILYYTIL